MMNLVHFHLKINVRTFSKTVAALLILTSIHGCGGGGGGNGSMAVGAVTASTSADIATNAPAVAEAIAKTESVAESESEANLALAIQSTVPGSGEVAREDVLATAVDKLQVSGEQTVSTADSAVMPGQAVSVPVQTAASGRIFYIDSKLGNDANDGRSASSGANGVGPWRTLAKLASASSQAGDVFRLACGSVWKETLNLAASGTAAAPIIIQPAMATCAVPPTIDGSATIAASAWTRHSGNIYKTTLAMPPLQLFSASGTMTVAHHPNRGYSSADPTSLYLKTAADSALVNVSGRLVSNAITTGTDLVLPAGAAIPLGTTVRVRTTAWRIDESKVSAVSGNVLTLATATQYPVKAGWGYFLLGQLWMLDSPGEWYYDASSRTLYAWMPNSAVPAEDVAVTQLFSGVDLSGRQYVTVEGVSVRKTAIAYKLQRAVGVVVKSGRVDDTEGLGVDAAGSSAVTISGNTFTRTGDDAIRGVDPSIGIATGLQVLDNTFVQSGVVLNGTTVESLPRMSRAVIYAGNNATVSGNVISYASYNGIWASAGNTVSNNVITGACMTIDDCAGIYASSSGNRSTINGNLVRQSYGAVAGKGPDSQYTQAQGIYLDLAASGVMVTGNTAYDNDHGLHLHVSSANLIQGNTLYGNRNSQMWLQEDTKVVNAAGDLFGNVVNGNQIVATTAAAKGIFLDTVYTSTANFGSFDSNRYFDSIYPMIVVDRAAVYRNEMNYPAWRAETLDGAPRNADANGFATSRDRFAAVMVNGVNIVPNGALASALTGWTTWNATRPYATLTRVACGTGWCANYVAGASASTLSSPNFSISGDQWYRLSVDVAGEIDGQLINLVVRRGGGGTNGYESVADRPLNFNASTMMKRYHMIFKATKTVKASDPLTLDLGARVDFQNISSGQRIRATNLELVPIVPADALTRSDLLVNATATPTQVSCPVASTQPSLCPMYVRLSDNQAVSWPYYLPARSTAVVYTRDSRLIDADADGVPDAQDACPGTAADLGVNSRGCAIGQ